MSGGIEGCGAARVENDCGEVLLYKLAVEGLFDKWCLSRDLKYEEKILWLLEAGEEDRTLFQAEWTPLSSPELYLDVLPSELGRHSVAPEFGTRTWVESTGGRSQLKRSAELLENRMGSSLKALSGPCDWHPPSRSGHKFLLGKLEVISQILSDLKILFEEWL